jgi:hypothetical protein
MRNDGGEGGSANVRPIVVDRSAIKNLVRGANHDTASAMPDFVKGSYLDSATLAL